MLDDIRVRQPKPTDMARLIALTRSFAPEVADQFYVEETWPMIGEAASRCWQLAMQRVCTKRGTLLGYVSGILVKESLWDVATSTKVLSLHHDAPDHLLSRSDVYTKHPIHPAFLWIADIAWDTTQPPELQVRVVKALIDHVHRYFLGHALKGYFLHCLPQYKPVADAYGAPIAADLGELGFVIGESDERDYRQLHEATIPDKLLTPPSKLRTSYKAIQSDQAIPLSDGMKKTGRFLVEYDWDVPAVARERGWKLGSDLQYSAYWSWLKAVRERLCQPNVPELIKLHPWLLCPNLQ